jgi:hypothetical protein
MSAPKNIGASVRARLLNRARVDKVDFNLMLTRHALERVLYRLSMSAWSNEFLLKGALLFDLWFVDLILWRFVADVTPRLAITSS